MCHPYRLQCLAIATTLALSACASTIVPPSPVFAPIAKQGVNPAHFDTTANPCIDFYRYAIGGWQTQNPIPASRARWGAFDEIESNNRSILKTILDAGLLTKASGEAKQVFDFYASGLGAGNITHSRNALDELTRPADTLAATFAKLHTIGTPAGFNFSVRQDQRNSSRYIAQLHQGGLGLPEREYYFATDARSEKQRKAYTEHIANMLALAGAAPASATRDAAAIMALETELARAAMPRVEARDPDKTYNLMTLAQLKERAPGFLWEQFFAGVGVSEPGDINVGQPAFFQAFGKLVAETPVETWQAYTRWHTLRTAAPYLGDAFENESFAFYGKNLTGTEAMEPRDRRVIATLDRVFGDALGKLYVEKAFSPTAKAKAQTLVANVRSALRDRINALDWMSEATKKEAIAKLDAINVKIGYPDKWKDYSAVEIKRDDYLGNVLNATRAEFQRQVARLGKPIDRDVWGMTAPQVNAYYSAGLNEIVFPAGILQPPFFDERADDASNYGGIGMVIGHELTHGFDDRGRKFDAVGNRRDWWTETDAARYTAKADAIAKQYDAFAPLPDMKINGKFTLGENIADFGGLRVAYLGMQRAHAQLEQQFLPALGQRPADVQFRIPRIDGLTANQRFFLNYAQSWRQNMREPELRRRLMTDSHSPARFRVLGPLGNLPEFSEAFGCKSGDAMVRDTVDQVTIW